MTHFLRKNWLLIFWFAAWLPTTPILWSIPTAEATKQFSDYFYSIGKEVEQGRVSPSEKEQKELSNNINMLSDTQSLLIEFRMSWTIQVFVTLFGLSAIVIAALRMKGWQLGLVLSSVAYLALVHGFPFLRSLHVEQWQSWWILATMYPQWGVPVTYREIIFPLFHVILIAVFTVIIVQRLLKRPNPALKRDSPRSGRAP